MPDRDEHNSQAGEPVHAVTPPQGAEGPATADEGSGRETAPPSPEEDQPAAPRASDDPAGEASKPRGDHADESPMQTLQAVAGTASEEAAGSITQATDEVGQLIDEVEALCGSDDRPGADAVAPPAVPPAVPPAAPPAPTPDHVPPADVPAGTDAENPAPAETADDVVDHVVDQVMEQVPPGAQASAAAGTSAAAGDAGVEEGDPALAAIDEALAKDVELLLEGSFEVVSEVLDDVFDEQAIAIPADDEDLAETSGQVEGTGSTAAREQAENPPAEPATEETADELSALTDAAAFETVEEVVGAAAADAPIEEPPVQAIPRTEAEAVVDAVTEAAAPPEDGAESGVAVNRGPVSELLPPRSPGKTERPKGPAEADSSPPPATALPAEQNPEPKPKPAAEAPPAEDLPEDEAAAVEPTELVPSILARVEPVIRVALGILNYPLRFVPPPVRPIVDWIALSLVFWVPIVWIVALFVIGR